MYGILSHPILHLCIINQIYQQVIHFTGFWKASLDVPGYPEWKRSASQAIVPRSWWISLSFPIKIQEEKEAEIQFQSSPYFDRCWWYSNSLSTKTSQIKLAPFCMHLVQLSPLKKITAVFAQVTSRIPCDILRFAHLWEFGGNYKAVPAQTYAQGSLSSTYTILNMTMYFY